MKTQHLYFRYLFNTDLSNKKLFFVRQLYFTYSIKRLLFALVDCQYALLKSTCSKTSYLTPCIVPYEWTCILHHALIAY